MQFRLSVAGEEKKNLSDDNGQSVRVIIGNVRKSSNDPRHRQTSFLSLIEYPIIKIFQPSLLRLTRHSFCMTMPLLFICQRVVLIHTLWYYLPGVFGALNTSVCFAGVSLSGWDPFCFSRTRSISLWMEVKVRGFFSFVLWALTDDTFWADKVQQKSFCSQ